MSNVAPREVFVLAGPTATGKSDLAHRVAREQGWAILSADAMLVYRGMDIGTAKPSPEERQGIPYGGIDLVTPDQPFSVGAWLEEARTFLHTLPPTQRVLVVGGTGLYLKSLLQGLDPMPSVDPGIRAAAEALYEREGSEGLRKACREADPERYEALKDKENPRRLMRALELARMGVPMQRLWERALSKPIVVLDMDRDRLLDRIASRVETMYRAGLLDEARALRERYSEWSVTARMAIGYREALAVLNNEMTETQAKAETTKRTRHLARRQGTWFRNQLPAVTAIVPGEGEHMDLARQVYDHWSAHGPYRIVC